MNDQMLIDQKALEEAAKWLEVHSPGAGSSEFYAAQDLRAALQPEHFASVTTTPGGPKRYSVCFRPDGKQQGIYSVVMAEDYDALRGLVAPRQISATDVRSLQTLTGEGVLNCKKALQAAGGDFQKAQELLRTWGNI